MSIILGLLFILNITGCSVGKEDTVIIYSSQEDFRNERMQEMLEEKFPEYNIVIQQIATGKSVSKFKG